MGKWIFALAGIAACVVGGISANQGRVDLVKVSKAALDAPKVLEEGKKAGLLLDFDEVNKEFPIPPDDQNFAMVVPDVIRLCKDQLRFISKFVVKTPNAAELERLETMKAGLDLAVKESNRTGFRSQKTYKRYGAYDSAFEIVSFCNAISYRALYRGQRGDIEGCLQDLRASNRIGYLISLESTNNSWRNAAAIIGNASEVAITLSANEFAKDPIKLERLQRVVLESQSQFDVNRYIRLSCFAAMNSARNKIGFGEDESPQTKKFIKNGLAPDARGRLEQYKRVKMFTKIQSAWEDTGHDVVKFESKLKTLDVGIEVGMQSPGELFLSVTPAVNVMYEQRRALANIEATKMTLKYGRWATLSEINGSFMIDPRTGEKFEITYSGNAPEFIKHEVSEAEFAK